MPLYVFGSSSQTVVAVRVLLHTNIRMRHPIRKCRSFLDLRILGLLSYVPHTPPMYFGYTNFTIVHDCVCAIVRQQLPLSAYEASFSRVTWGILAHRMSVRERPTCRIVCRLWAMSYCVHVLNWCSPYRNTHNVHIHLFLFALHWYLPTYMWD